MCHMLNCINEDVKNTLHVYQITYLTEITRFIFEKKHMLMRISKLTAS